MGKSIIKNPRKLFSLFASDDLSPANELRLSTLENNEYKITYFTEISSTTGTITIPTGATILLDQLQGGVDAYVSTIQNSQPTGIFPQTGGGVTVDVSSFDALGNYTLSGNPSSYPVALIYILKIKAKDYSNLITANILDLEEINVVSQTITNGVTNKAPSEDAVFDALALKENAFSKNTAFNKNFGTGTTNIVEIDSTLGNTKPVITSSSGKLQTSDWVNIVSSCTFVGWSSYTNQEVDVLDMGTHYLLHVLVSGTSNSATTTIQLPYTTLSTNNGSGLFTNNGTSIFGRWVFSNGGTTITFTTTATGVGWTASGTKGVGIDIYFKK